MTLASGLLIFPAEATRAAPPATRADVQVLDESFLAAAEPGF